MAEKVLMCVMNYYTCPFRVGSHHYAWSFKKLGYDVAYISKPLSPWHLLFSKNRERTDRFEIWRKPGDHQGRDLVVCADVLVYAQPYPPAAEPRCD